jgi:hypothetical protein
MVHCGDRKQEKSKKQTERKETMVIKLCLLSQCAPPFPPLLIEQRKRSSRKSNGTEGYRKATEQRLIPSKRACGMYGLTLTQWFFPSVFQKTLQTSKNFTLHIKLTS